MDKISQRKVYSGIDFFKFVAAVLVVVLHAVETSSWYPCEVKYVLTRFAVPFFLIASGFFFACGLQRADDPKAYFVRYEKNLLLLYAIWAFVLYLPFTLNTYLQKYAGESIWRIAVYICRRLFVIGPGPYWYLMAMICAAAFLYLCHRSGSKTLLIIGIVTGFLLEIVYSCFQGLLGGIPVFGKLFSYISLVFSWEFNFIMFGIPFMGVGYLIAKCDINWKMRTAIIIFAASTLLRVVEYNLSRLFPNGFWQENMISIAFIPQSIAFFMMGKNWQPKFGRERSLYFRNLSTCIYLTHAIFLYEILDPLLSAIPGFPAFADWMIGPKVILTLVMCMLVFVIVKKINNKHLNRVFHG